MSAEPCVLNMHDDLDISHRCMDESEIQFANVIGKIEDTLMQEKFLTLHHDFMDENYHHFEDNEENKFIYTEIFTKYINTIEKYIESELVASIPDFDMVQFEVELNKRRNDLDGEIFEILSTFTDFLLFKEKFIDYKRMKDGTVADFSNYFSIKKYEIN